MLRFLNYFYCNFFPSEFFSELSLGKPDINIVLVSYIHSIFHNGSLVGIDSRYSNQSSKRDSSTVNINVSSYNSITDMLSRSGSKGSAVGLVRGRRISGCLYDMSSYNFEFSLIFYDYFFKRSLQ